jgi:Gly-Xaa carboxypeptidase
VWGRGAADDKSLLVSQWEAITHLLEAGWKPRRTVIITHGFDEEEVHARRGQGHIAPFLEKRYGKDGLLMVVDEGSGTGEMYGGAFALPGTGEKGYLDIVMRVGTAGGHSSMPPKHTGIGIMSQIINALEENPFETKLTPDSPLLQGVACLAQAKSFPKKYAKLLKSRKGWDKLAHIFAEEGVMQRALVSTTIAVDVVNGGVKVNALPELVEAMVNFRIDFSESLQSTKDHVSKIAAKVAKKHDLEYRAWSGKDEHPESGRFVTLEVLGAPLEPAPNTPTSGGVWDLFAGTVRAAMPSPDGEPLIVAPFATPGNTDCKMYYNLTKHVYRFMGSNMANMANIHTVDEKFKADEHHRVVDWVHALIQNADAYDGEQ